MSVVSPSVLPGNILTLTDSDFESGSPSWVPYTNANAPSVAAGGFSGTHSLSWTANATGSSTGIFSGFYPCTANNGYEVSGLVLSSAVHDAYIGVSWYTSGGSLISTSLGSDYPTSAGIWQTLNAAVTSPATAAKFKVIVQMGTSVAANEAFYIDLMYAADTNVQVLIDWINPAFTAQSIAGLDFLDMTPWVRLVDNITISRGRQNGINEIQAGSAQFTVENDSGWFTKYNSGSPVAALSGTVDLGARCQINMTDESGNWHTRFDGPVSEIDYAIDPTGFTNIASIILADVFAYLSRQPVMYCWTKSAVLASSPWLHWSLDDVNNTDGVAAETSGNNGPVLRPLSASGAGTITWQNSNGGIETLADAAQAIYNDMSDSWPPGARVNANIGSGLESRTVGPYTTPMPAVFFAPSVSTGSYADVFVDNTGYSLITQLNEQTGKITPSSGSYSIEAWFAVNPGLPPYYNQLTGPFTVFDVSSSRTGVCLMFGLYPNTSDMLAQLARYAVPPTLTNFSSYPTIQQSTSTVFSYDVFAPLPHHVVVNISGSTAALWYDGTYVGSIGIPAGTILDSVSVGGAYGGWGAFWGNIQLFSIYKRQLSESEIIQHCQLGQYGMWEAPTDVCVSQLAKFAGIPQFWNGITDDYAGLSLTDYYDITNHTPLANMQAYEQAERGLLYVSGDGKLKFSTRDWRMGFGAPNLQLPADTYNASFGYQIIDQYLINRATLTTFVYQQNVIAQASNSQSRYGNYPATGQYPLITWNRVGVHYGLPQYAYSPDPAVSDNANWQANTSANSRLTFGSLSFDMLTLDPNDGIAISQLYALDINSMVSLAGTPASMANATGANELFIEGVQETIGLSQRLLTFYTSPAAQSRAWIPGNSTYGQLGATTTIGVSESDNNPVPAMAKDVSHDASPPYWPPAFTSPLVPDVRHMGYHNFTGTAATFSYGIGLKRTYQNDSICVVVMCPTAATITVSDTLGNTYFQASSQAVTGGTQYVFLSQLSLPLNGSDTITVSGSVSQAHTVGVFAITGVIAGDAGNTNSGTSTSPSVSITGVSGLYDVEFVSFFNFANTPITAIPSGWSYVDSYSNGSNAYATVIWRQIPGALSDSVTAAYSSSISWGAIDIAFRVAAPSLNNPSSNGHAFVGALEVRGLHDNLATALEPPLMNLSQHNQQTIPTGNNATPQMLWSTIDVDTANGVGAVPAWANWYVCTVPGFYELTGQVAYQPWFSGAAGVRNGYFAVAAQGARHVAGTTGTPIANSNYVCIVGEQHQFNNYGIRVISSPATRIYLGLGDMVGLCTTQNQGANDLTNATVLGYPSMLSARWCGYSTLNDQVMINDTIGAAGTVTQLPTDAVQVISSASTTTKTFTRTFASNGNHSYYGANSPTPNVQRSSGGTVYQGQASSLTGTQYAFVTFPYSTIQSDVYTGTVLSVTLTFSNTGSYYGSGEMVQLGWTTQTSFGSPYTLSSVDHPNCQTLRLKPNSSYSIVLNNWANVFAESATALLLGDNQTTAPVYSSQFSSSWSLIITYQR